MGKPMMSVTRRKRGHVVRRARAFEPQMHEVSKRALLFRGPKCGEFGKTFLQDVKRIKDNEDTVLFTRKNEDVRPFEDETKAEFFANKNHCGLFAYASHSKKRPNNLVLGRVYDSQILDQVEFEIENFASIEEVTKRTGVSKAMGSQTAMIFQGEDFDRSSEMESARSLLMDLFKARYHEQIDLTSLDHVIVCTATGGKIYVRSYVIGFGTEGEKSSKTGTEVLDGVKIPNLSLVEMGPALNLSIRRSRLPSPELMKLALKQPKYLFESKKVKNVTNDKLQGKLGRVHMKKQDFGKLVTRSRFKKALPRGQHSKGSK